jgi:small-conductance mechanosensitive channel
MTADIIFLDNLLRSFRSFIHHDLAFQIIVSLLVFIIFILIAKAVSYLSTKVLKPLVTKTTGDLDDRILEVVEGSSYRILIMLGAYLALGFFQSGFSLISEKSNRSLLQEYPGLIKASIYIDNTLYIILVLQVLYIVTRLVYVIFDWYAEKGEVQENKDLRGSIIPLLKKTSRLILTCAAALVVLTKFSIDISAFLLSLGVGSLAIALAAQDTLSNMISGFIIMTDRPFRIGDRIKIGNDIFGDVTTIGVRSTKILDFDKNTIIVPNNDIVKSRIINLTYPSSHVRVLVDINLPFGVNIAEIKEKLKAIASADPDVDKSVPPEANLLKLADSWLEFQLAVRVHDYKKAFDLRCRLRETIYTKFLEEGIEFPMPRHQINIKNQPAPEIN